jgi:hypothetical protein
VNFGYGGKKKVVFATTDKTQLFDKMFFLQTAKDG